MSRFDISDYSLIVIEIGFVICIILIVFFGIKDNGEKDCLDYYKSNNGYILEGCKKYEDKLKDIKEDN